MKTLKTTKTMKNLKEQVEELIQSSEYNQACKLVAKEMELTLDVKFLEYAKYFDGDKEPRDIYKCTLKRGSRSYSFKFGQSISCSGEYVGHKHMCYNKFGKDRFTKDEFNKNKYFNRDCEIKPNKNFSEPKMYNILACLTKYDPGEFEEFCDEYGYDADSKSAEKTYNAVLKEWNGVQALFSDKELEILHEIQ